MLKKILSASLVILHIFTQSASALEIRPIIQPIIPVQSLQISSDILKNENPLSVSNAFSFFNISDSFVNQPLAGGQGLSVYSGVIAGQTLSNRSGWRLTVEYRAIFLTLITLNGFRGNPSSDSMGLPEIKNQLQVKPDYSSGFMPSEFFGMRYADVMSGSSWVLQTTKRFVYDGWNMVEEQTVAGTTKYYVYGLDLSQSLQGAGGVGGLLAKAEGTATHQYFYDANGNISQMINASSGAVDARYEYDAYGNSILATGTQAAGNTMRFSTKYLDTEFTLYYYGYRYYDPATGRWLSRDPLEEDGGLLLFGFNLNNPINNFDADGRAVETGWDLFNVGSGIISLGCNIASGNVIGALVDGAGLLYDATATSIPGLPGGAHTAIELYRAGSIAPKMYRFLEANQTARNVYRFAVRKRVDEAHHIIPRGGSPINWTNKALRKQMDALRARARKLGFDIDGAENGVALPADWHKNNTLGEVYYKRVVDLFQDANTREQFINKADQLAEELLKESKKIQ